MIVPVVDSLTVASLMIIGIWLEGSSAASIISLMSSSRQFRSG